MFLIIITTLQINAKHVCEALTKAIWSAALNKASFPSIDSSKAISIAASRSAVKDSDRPLSSISQLLSLGSSSDYDKE